MIKDRIETLQIIQDSIHNASDNVTIDIENQEVPVDPYLIEVEEILDLIRNIQINVLDVKKKHSDILSNPQNDEKTKQELEDLMSNIKSHSIKARTKLKILEQSENEEFESGVSSAYARMKNIQNSTLARKFVDVMTEYNITQIDHRDRCKARIKRQLEITGRQTSDEELEMMLEQDNPTVFTQGIVMEEPDLKKTVADIEARYADIIKLENSIKELHDMFIDMALLVENHGELMNRVEYHVDNTQEYVEFGKMELGKAHVYRNKAQKKKFIIIACVTVSSLVVILILLAKIL